MFKTPDGKEIFILDCHTHFWNGSPENQRNVHGKQFIDCFYAYHTALSPKEQLWEKSRFDKQTVDQVYGDLFIDGPDDMAIIQSTYLKDFYKEGFSSIERSNQLAAVNPGRFIVNGSFDPRDGEKALEYIHYMKETFDIKGVKMYTAEWNGDSKGWRLNDPSAYKCFELCEKLGIKNVHVHKGPTILPLSKDAFAVGDVDDAATEFQGLNWIIEHCGLPRLDDFCWIATQETNVYGGLAVALPFIHSRPRYFAEVIAELLFWIGPEKILFGSDYAIWTPQWLVEKLWAFQIPDDIAQERGVQLTDDIKEKILGLNAARLYDIDVAAKKAELAGSPVRIAAE
ncbi:amidohydrolase family protein [Haematobacter missouriensis]|uniref:Amidohydrolase n=1 Tax=Haematobacter missouriensis TaxID=366616 RepID=A0ABX3ZN15_9RHOB|nr:amidohydrolase family protein [Haematobacter missouriensis]OWJ70441.1 amidohydrolase [Haematobacter missouriensis]